MKYTISVLVPFTFEIDVDNIDDLPNEIDKYLPPNYGGDGIHIEAEDGTEWDE